MLVISAALDLDLDIAAECAHEAEQPLKGETLEAPAQQIGNVGLADSHPLGRSLLGESSLLDHLSAIFLTIPEFRDLYGVRMGA
jgi:hypothetical protein